ncbi:MAG TPA: hypothetical protein VFN98_06065, partial [Nitrososphaeraceae archaeon]|nr:hypothetical protein [Nitrososphaeraceae archaeon]
GFVAGARSKHYTDQECFADTYYGRMTYDGRISFEKELFHTHGDTAQFLHLRNLNIYGLKAVGFHQQSGLDLSL